MEQEDGHPVSASSLARRMTLKSSGIPVKQWVECAHCLEPSKDESDVNEWAERHGALHPGHVRFRTVSQAYWQLEPRRVKS